MDRLDRRLIGVYGAGSIGCFLGGKLAASGSDVVMVGRLGRELAAHGLTLTELDGAAGGARHSRDGAVQRGPPG